MIKFDYFLADQLKDDKLAEAYLNSLIESYFEDNDKALFLKCLQDFVRLRGGMSKISKDSKINRQHLYKILSPNGNPTLDNLRALLIALGFKLKIEI